MKWMIKIEANSKFPTIRNSFEPHNLLLREADTPMAHAFTSRGQFWKLNGA